MPNGRIYALVTYSDSDLPSDTSGCMIQETSVSATEGGFASDEVRAGQIARSKWQWYWKDRTCPHTGTGRCRRYDN